MPSSILNLFWRDYESGEETLSRTREVVLTTKLVSVMAHNLSLKLWLRNDSPAPVTVLTGVIAGHSYAAANFNFSIQLPRKRNVKLVCWSCFPAIVGGTLGPYEINLQPGESSVVAVIPIADFSYGNGGDEKLCTPATNGSLLTATIQGRRWPVRDVRDSYWTGFASATIVLTCADSQMPQ